MQVFLNKLDKIVSGLKLSTLLDNDFSRQFRLISNNVIIIIFYTGMKQ